MIYRQLTMIGSVVLTFVSALPAFAWTEEQSRIGAENHPNVLAQFGGEIKDEALKAYVAEIGLRIAAVTPRADDPWIFTVVDSPIVNAVAAPGGYVYVTRGLLALANSEAELAAVIGHEIAHLTAEHHVRRDERNDTVSIGVLIGTALGGLLAGRDGLQEGKELSAKVAQGFVANFTQSQELEADELGTQYLSLAGYDPAAQARILTSLNAKNALEAQIAGKGYNPNRVDIFASHPSTGNRVQLAAGLAADLPGDEIAKERYLRSIDGIIYGDTPEQGFVRGQRFVHPVERFEFFVPPGFVIQNSTQAVLAEDGKGSRFYLSLGGLAEGDILQNIEQVWFKEFEQLNSNARLYDLELASVSGLEAARARVDVTINGRSATAELTLVNKEGVFFRLTGVTAAGNEAQLQDFAEAAQSFRLLTDEEAALELPMLLKVVTTKERDTAAGLSARMPLAPYNEGVFRALNGLVTGDVEPGDTVKLVVQ